ncbi:MAG: hypothetical protein CL454_00745 [Acidimicrobiaceae bacterium]|nr:hypothetical protein [Acidimicrobiaceae bacterium]
MFGANDTSHNKAKPPSNMVNIDHLMAQIASSRHPPEKLSSAGPKSEVSRKARPSSSQQQHFGRSVYNTCNDMLEMYTNPAASVPNIKHVHVANFSNLTLPVGVDSALQDLMGEQQNRVRLQGAMDAKIVDEVERAVRSIRQEETRIEKWHSARVAALNKSRRQWHSRADALAKTRGETNIPARVSVEREWRDLARSLPKGHARDILEAGLPLNSRAELAELVGGGGSASMVSRTKKQGAASSNTQNVQWKLRHSVDDTVDNHIHKANRSAQMAVKSIAAGVVHRCRHTIDAAKAEFDANDAIAENRAQLLMQELRARGVPFEHLMGYCAEITQRNQTVQMNRFAALLAEK